LFTIDVYSANDTGVVAEMASSSSRGSGEYSTEYEDDGRVMDDAEIDAALQQLQDNNDTSEVEELLS
jgi:hypothetical protein